jgi:hypothetical protein
MVGKDSCLIEGFAEANILNVKLSRLTDLFVGVIEADHLEFLGYHRRNLLI